MSMKQPRQSFSSVAGSGRSQPRTSAHAAERMAAGTPTGALPLLAQEAGAAGAPQESEAPLQAARRRQEPDLHERELTVKLRELELLRSEGPLRVGQQLTQSHAMICMLGGEATVTHDSGEARLAPGSVYVCAPERTFGMVSGGEGGALALLIRFDLFAESGRGKRWLKAQRRSELADAGQALYVEAGELGRLCGALLEHWQATASYARLRSQIVFQELLLTLLASLQRTEASHNALERAQAYMEAHYDEPLTVAQLAGLAGISPKYFVELYKKTYGHSVTDSLTSLRMSRAKQLMATPGLKLKEVAHQVGYPDEYYFSRRFKQTFGLSPSAYLQRRSRRIALFGSPLIGQLAALGLLPYAAPLHPKWAGYYFRTYGSDIPVHLSAYRMDSDWRSNLATLDAVRPELIISPDELGPERRKGLEAIAPVFYVPAAAPWREQLRATARYLGEPEAAEQWLASYEHKAAAARATLGAALRGETVVTLRLLKEQLYLYSNRSMAEVLYGDLGVASAFAADAPRYDRPVTVDELDRLQPSYVLLMVCHESETLAYWKRLQQTAEWQSLACVRRQRLHLIPSDPWREYSPVAHERQLEQALALFAGNCPSSFRL